MLSPATSPTMVGRARELAAVREAQATTLSGTPHGVVVGGEAGIGKTRLLTELVSGLPDGVVVARGQCVARGSLAAPFAPLREVLRDLVAHFGKEGFLRSAGPTGRLLSALLPELAEDGPAAIAQAQLYDAVSLLLQNLSAQSPLVVIVEDVHWADLPTLDLLLELLQVLRRGRVLVAISYRTDDVGRDHPLRPLLHEVERSRAITRVELGRLTPEESVEQARRIRDGTTSEDDLTVLVARSDGVPFLVEELLAVEGAADAPLPETLRELVLSRYGRLSVRAQAVLRLVSAGGVTVDHDVLSAVYDGDPEVLEGALREAVGTQVLRADGTSYAFRHALTQEAVHAELLPGELVRLHTRYAQVLEGLRGSAGRSVEVAHHRLAAHDPVRALPALVAAATEAAAAGAPVSSAHLGEQALRLWPEVPDAEHLAGTTRLDLVRQVVLTYATAGDPRAVPLLDDAIAATPPEDARGRALLLHDAMMVRHSSGQEGFLEVGREALALLPPEDDEEEGRVVRARVQCGLACAMLIAPEPGGVEMMNQAMDLARELVRSSRDPGVVERARFELSRGLTNLAWERYRSKDSAAALASLSEVQALGGQDPHARLRHDDRASRILLGLGRAEAARTVAEEGMELARELGMEAGWGSNLAVTRARASLALGDLTDATDVLRRVRASRYDANLSSCAEMEIQIALARDDLPSALRTLETDHQRMERVRATEIDDDLHVAHAMGRLELARGDLAAAWEQVRHVWKDVPMVPAFVCPLVVLGARVLAELRGAGEDPPGEPSADAERRLRTVLSAQGQDEIVEDWRAILDAELSGPEGTGADVEAWQAAVEAAGRGRLPVVVRAESLHRCAAAYLGAGDREGAAGVILLARDLADHHGLLRAGRLIEELAGRAGLDRRPPASGNGAVPVGIVPGETPLTARERQVLELVAQGLTNRQIGGELFISDKTVSVHVSAILRKLGASSRSQAAARADAVLG